MMIVVMDPVEGKKERMRSDQCFYVVHEFQFIQLVNISCNPIEILHDFRKHNNQENNPH